MNNSYHVITTDHPLMKKFGFSSFTVDQLKSWFFQTDSAGNFKNLKYIKGIKWQKKDFNKSDESPIDYVYKVMSLFLTPENGAYLFDGWRQNYRAGRYITFNRLEKWTYTKKDRNTNIYFIYKDLQLQEFNNQTSQMTPVTPDPSWPANYTVEYVPAPYKIPNTLTNIIEANKFVVLVKAANIPYSFISLRDRARIEFIRDIKTSKNKCLTWKVNIPFQFYLDETTLCDYPQEVTFKLFLYDNDNTTKKGNSIAPMSNMMVAVPASPWGTFGKLTAGGINTVDTNNSPANEAAGQLDMSYNPNTGKFESGTQQIIAVVESYVEAAHTENVDTYINGAVEDMINNHTIFPKGSGIPLNMWNNNPNALAPVYNTPNHCRKDGDFQKIRIPFVNISNRAWNPGDKCILSKINGFWIPSPLADAPPAPVVPTSSEGWQFTYLMTNTDYFHRPHNYEVINGGNAGSVSGYFPQGIQSYSDYEQNVYNYYYGEFPNNNEGFAMAEAAASKLDFLHGYFQFTSFDFMGTGIGGVRKGFSGNNALTGNHALSCTQYFENPRGIEFNGLHKDGSSSPFFGCVFPDGYQTTKATTYKNTPAQMTPTNTGWLSIVPTGTNMWQNRNDVYKPEANYYGMFPSGELTKHLPADIALNASPNTAEYGAPIKDISFMTSFNPYYNNSSSFLVGKNYISNIEKAFFYKSKYNIWMYQANNPNVSTFDFKPVNANKIQFRPLKMETYAMFEVGGYAYGKGFDQLKIAGQKEKGMFGSWIQRHVGGLDNWPANYNSFKLPVGELTLNRNLYNCFNLSYRGKTINDIKNQIPTLIFDSYKKLEIEGKDKPAAGGAGGGNYYGIYVYGLTYNDALVTDRNYLAPFGDVRLPKTTISENAFFPFPIWNLPFFAGGTYHPLYGSKGPFPAGGIGIIGASTTVTAKASITFNTEFVLGMDTWFGGSNKNYPSWGGSNLQNTSRLFVRIFQSWPKNLTIYDQRLFAIFHFNHGAGFSPAILSDGSIPADEKTILYKQAGYEVYRNRIQIANPTVAEYQSASDYVNGNFTVVRPISDNEVPLPTLYDGSFPAINVRSGDNETPGTRVSINGLFHKSNPFVLTAGLWRDYDHYNVDPNPRGKLLPYESQSITICPGPPRNILYGVVGNDEKISINYNNRCFVPFDGKIDQEYYAGNYDIIIQERGVCYDTEDIFTTRGGSGSGVFLNPIVDGGRRIVGFTRKDSNAGGGFLPEDFLDGELKFYNRCTNTETLSPKVTSLSMPIEIIPYKLVSKGTGFKGGFSCGSVIKDNKTINKPKEFNATPLTPPAPTQTGNEFKPILQGNLPTTVAVNGDPNNKYDVFFRFHNDVSHTFSDEHYVSLQPNAYEQHVTVTINPA